MSSCFRYSRSNITPRTVIIFVVCIEMATAFAFTWRPVQSIYWHSPAWMTGLTYPSSGSTEFIACTYTDNRGTGAHGSCGRGTACLMVGRYCGPVSSFDPLRMGGGVRGHNRVMFNHRAPSRRLQETCSYSSNRRGVREFTETALTAIKVPDDVFFVDARDQALVGGGDGVLGQEVDATYEYASSPNENFPSSRGLEYWGYRALVLVVAALCGTNFPVVRACTMPLLYHASAGLLHRIIISSVRIISLTHMSTTCCGYMLIMNDWRRCIPFPLYVQQILGRTGNRVYLDVFL